MFCECDEPKLRQCGLSCPSNFLVLYWRVFVNLKLSYSLYTIVFYQNSLEILIHYLGILQNIQLCPKVWLSKFPYVGDNI